MMLSRCMVPSRITFMSVLDGGSSVTRQGFWLLGTKRFLFLSLTWMKSEAFRYTSTKQINLSVYDLDGRSSITRQWMVWDWVLGTKQILMYVSVIDGTWTWHISGCLGSSRFPFFLYVSSLLTPGNPFWTPAPSRSLFCLCL